MRSEENKTYHSFARATVIPVRAASRSYSVHVGTGLLASAGVLIAEAVPKARRVHIFADDGLPMGVPTDLTRRLTEVGLAVSHSSVKATEEGKSVQGLYHMLRHLANHNLERSDAVVALGGGIVGDMAGFAAATYRRGIAWINCPTTLLAMVDASVGGKTGVNLPVPTGGGGEVGAPPGSKGLLKNMVGAFWQPSLVLADVEVVGSLSERAFRSGLAECIKHAMLGEPFGGNGLMASTKGSLGSVLAREPAALTDLIGQNIRIKAAVVGTDEREEAADPNHSRALLNLGHTFGHAIETIPTAAPGLDGSLAPLLHGEAVALGLVCAMRCAELMKLVGAGACDALRTTLGHAGLPTQAHGLPPAGEIYERMLHDKKSAGGRMRLVLPVGEGRCRVVDAPPRPVVIEAIEAIRG